MTSPSPTYQRRQITVSWPDGSRPDESVDLDIPTDGKEGAATISEASPGTPFDYSAARDRGDIHPLNLCRLVLPRLVGLIHSGALTSDTWCDFFAGKMDPFMFISDVHEMRDLLGNDASAFFDLVLVETSEENLARTNSGTFEEPMVRLSTSWAPRT